MLNGNRNRLQTFCLRVVSRKTAGVITLASLLAGCAAARAPAVASHPASFEAMSEPQVFDANRLAEVPVGRYARVETNLAETLYEGTIVRVSAGKIVLKEAAAVVPRSPRILGSLPFEWSQRMFHGTDVESPDGEVSVDRRIITAVDVYEPDESERLIERQRRFRAEQKRLRQDLVTAQEFPNEG
jgi:hypothetical protein